MFWRLVLVALGGACGAVARYTVSFLFGKAWPSFPWGTLVVNVVGSFLLGLLMGATASGRFLLDPAWRSFLGIGILGAFTTFSTLSYETVEAVRGGSLAQALGMVLANLVLGLLFCWLGLFFGER